MIHLKVKGSPYEVGFQIGKKLQEEHCFHSHILDLPKERMEYVNACIPIYKQYYPSVLEELSGISDALKVDVSQLECFTLGMYAYSMDTHCSCFACNDEEHYFLGRNSDFLKVIKDVCMHIQYEEEKEYRFLANTTSFTQMEDGMNEHGLAIGLTFVVPQIKKPGFNAGMLVRYILAKCRSVEEAIQVLHKLPIGSSQTLTMMDASGAMAMVECNCEKQHVIHHNQHVFAVNNFYSDAMKDYKISPFLGDLRCDDRYHTLTSTFSEHAYYDFTFVQNLLSGSYGFLCQYDETWPADTVWSSIYDVKNKVIWLSVGNPSRMKHQQVDFV